MDHRLGAGFNTSDVVTHGIKAGLGGVDLNDAFKGRLASGELIFEELAVGFALFKEKRLGVLTGLEHSFDVSWFANMWFETWFSNHPSWCKPSGNSSSHLFLRY